MSGHPRITRNYPSNWYVRSQVHQKLTGIFTSACLNVLPKYINFKVKGTGTGGENDQLTIYRERVYCYELYHQMRLLMDEIGGLCATEESTSFTFNGEVDKTAHPILKDTKVGQRKPDFLVHCPGCGNDFNDTVIEVKKADVDKDGILKDLKSLCLFCTVANYKRAILLVYGTDPKSETKLALDKAIEGLKPIHSKLQHCVIEIWFHSCPQTMEQEPAVSCVGYLEVAESCFKEG